MFISVTGKRSLGIHSKRHYNHQPTNVFYARMAVQPRALALLPQTVQSYLCFQSGGRDMGVALEGGICAIAFAQYLHSAFAGFGTALYIIC